MTDLLLEQNAQLREEIAALKSVVHGDFKPLKGLGLSRYETKMFAAMVNHRIFTREMFWTCQTGGPDSDERSVHVMICRLRQKLASHGFTIHNQRSVGYYLSEPDRERGRRLLEGEQA